MKEPTVRRRYIVETHVGPEPTVATSPEKAISNVRYRLFGRTRDNVITKYWTVRIAAEV